MSSRAVHFGNDRARLIKAVAATRECSICHLQVRASMLAPHENRHAVEQQTKPCVQCGRPIQRRSRAGQKQWDQRQFCSVSCKGRWLAETAVPLRESFIEVPSGCWEWTRARNRDGYGVVRRHDRRGNDLAHRALWVYLMGPIPAGMHLDHLCRNRACVRPSHLEVVTPAENNRRAAAYRNECKFGHPLDGRRQTTRYCLTCHRQREQKRREARRVLAA